jgi:hypothetical protein
MRKAVIDEKGVVVNIVEVEEGSDWHPGPGLSLIDPGNSDIGDVWDKTEKRWVKPAQELPTDPVVEAREKLANAKEPKSVKELYELLCLLARAMGIDIGQHR